MNVTLSSTSSVDLTRSVTNIVLGMKCKMCVVIHDFLALDPSIGELFNDPRSLSIPIGNGSLQYSSLIDDVV